MKPVRDLGHAVEFLRPLKLPVFEPGGLPDPAQCVGCLILINDRGDGVPYPYLALSNGASWDRCARLADVPRGTIAERPSVNVQPLVERAVAQMLPALMPPMPPMPAIAAPVPLQAQAVPASDDLKVVADGMLAMAEEISALKRRMHELEQEWRAFQTVRVVTKVDAA